MSNELKDKIVFLENLRNFYQGWYLNLDLDEHKERKIARNLWDEADRQLLETHELLTEEEKRTAVNSIPTMD